MRQVDRRTDDRADRETDTLSGSPMECAGQDIQTFFSGGNRSTNRVCPDRQQQIQSEYLEQIRVHVVRNKSYPFKT